MMRKQRPNKTGTFIEKVNVPQNLSYLRSKAWPPTVNDVFYFSFPGNMPRKSNSRRIVQIKTKNGPRPLVIKSAEAQSWTTMVEESCRMILAGKAPIAGWVGMKVVAHYQSNRSDLSTELLKDALEAGGVYVNDRYVQNEANIKRIDPKNPRVEVWLWMEDPAGLPEELRDKLPKNT